MVIIDVSAYQAAISWPMLRAAGVRAAFLKATEGVGFEDAWFERNREAAGDAGIVTGAYHFARPDTVSSRRDAEAEAGWFLNVARPRRGDLLPALDFETPGLPPPALADWALAWLRRVAAAVGERPFFYTYPSFYAERLAPCATRLGDRSLLWLAAWGPNDGRPHAVHPIGAWRRVALHQYPSRGSLPGIIGPVDLNRLGPGVSLGAVRIGGSD
jgi:lysozyme